MSDPSVTATPPKPSAPLDRPAGARLVDVLDRLFDRGVLIRADLRPTVADLV